jgi:GNAT superfamily N-acetyltransferase
VTIQYRQPTEHDIDEISRLHVLCWQQAYAGILPEEYLKTLSIHDRAEGWRNTINDPEVFKLIACADHRIVGFVSAGPARDDAITHGDGEIYTIYNHRDFYRRGIGRNFLARAAEFWLTRSGRSLVVLFIAANAQAELFYSSLGGHHVHESVFDIAGITIGEKGRAFVNLAELAALTP